MSTQAQSRDDRELHLRVESKLPGRVAVGRGAVLLVHGWCFHARRPLRGLSVAIGAEPQPLDAIRMPRADVANRLGPVFRERETAYRSGFWGLVSIPSVSEPQAVAVAVEAHLDGGEAVRREIGSIDVAPAAPAAGGPAGERIAICMATHNPPAELFRRQVDSLRAQTHEDWVCLISDDASRPAELEEIRGAVESDPRFEVSPAPRRLGVYANFERALGLVPPDAGLVALADQDDRWYPHKLAALRDRLAAEPRALLAYSDMRIADPAGNEISPTFWTDRRNNHTDLRRLLMVNTVTGAASLFRRRLLDLALPFPEQLDDRSLHDHWLALAALAGGDVAYVDEPLYEYVQHPGAVQGHARTISPPEGRAASASDPRPGPLARARRRLAAATDRPRLRRHVLDRLLKLRRNYPPLLRVRHHARLLLLRGGGDVPRRKRRLLRRFAGLERSVPLLGWLALTAWRSRRAPSATLGVERVLLSGALWRGLLEAAKRLPPLGPQRQNLAMALKLPAPGEPAGAARLQQLIEPLRLDVAADEPSRVNLLIPTIDLGHFFGGYIAKFNLARKLAESGLRVRIACVDEPFYLPETWRRDIERFEGLEGIGELVELELAHDRSGALRVSPEDRFIATTWWTAHVAHRASAELGRNAFLYLIQEFEPMTFPMGSWAALARQTYDFPHRALFSTEMLREYFRREQIGVFARGDSAGDRDSVAFENAITPVRPPSEQEMRESERRLLFYARPELHAERNMFELGLLGLAAAEAEGLLDGWELHGIGAQQPGRLRYGRGLELEILERQDQSDYAGLLRSHSVGLSLMFTPHPSLVPLEMAAAGMPVVTNTFANKTREALAEISPNVIAVEPTIDGVREGLREAIAASADHERRRRGAEVRWSSDWEQSFGGELVQRLRGFIEAS